MFTSVFRTLKLTMRLFYPSLGQKIRTKKGRIRYICFLGKACYRYCPLFNSWFSYKLSAAGWLQKQQQKNLARKNRLVSFVLPAPVTVVTLLSYTEKKEVKTMI